MATRSDDIKWLYGKLKSKGYDIGNEDEFEGSLANEEDRKWYYEKARAMGLNIGSMDDFDSLFAPAPAVEAPAVSDSVSLSAVPQSQDQTTQATPVAASQVEPVSPQAAKQAWQPTEQDKIRMLHEMNSIRHDFD